MKLIFGALAIVMVLIVIITGSSVSWLSTSTLEQSKQEAVAALASGLAYSISSQMLLFEETVNQMAADEDVVAAVESGDAALLEKTAGKVQKFLPVALKVRLLLPSVNAIDERATPAMGYADLEMVQKTLAGKQPSLIQGEGANRHLAITAPIRKGNQVIGVVLASLKFDFLTELLGKAPINDNFVEISQQSIVLESRGDATLKSDSAPKLAIDKTSWQISYNAGSVHKLSDVSIISTVVMVFTVLSCVALFGGYYYMALLLKNDENRVLEAVKDLMTGKELGGYDVKLSEMQVIISTLLQFKRILDNKQNKESGESNAVKLNDKDLFDVEIEDDSVNKKLTDLFKKKKAAKPIAEAKPKVRPVREPEPVAKASPEAKATKPQTQASKPAVSIVNTPVREKPKLESIFKAYDIRGIVGKNLTKEIVYDIGMALGSEAKLKGVKIVVVARDGRLSSPDLCDGLIKGIISTGRNVLDVGVVPTPMLYFVSQHTEGRTGVMVTGSHNPPDYNGLKLVLQGEALAEERILQLKQRIDDEDFITETMGTVQQNSDYVEEYIGTICDDVRLERKLKIVVDCGNGATSELAPALLKELGCEVIPLFCQIDGNFPNHHPDPSKQENLQALIAEIKKQQADLGLAFDGDGDRLGVVDNQGKIIWPDRQMMLYAKHVLMAKSGSEIVYDVKCSRNLASQIRKHGGRPVMWKCGHSLIKGKLRETGAALAVDMTGHIFFNDRWFGFDDALYAAARLLEILSADSRTSSEIFADFPDSINTPEMNIAIGEGEKFDFMQQLIAQASFPDAEIIDIDGLRVEFKDGWGLVRASNTTPSLVLRFEADNAEALKRIQQQFKQHLLKVKADLALPF